MKLNRAVILAFVLQGAFLYGSNLNIDEQIRKIREAPQSQRYILVNELKKQIAQMNALEQARAIEQYQEQSIQEAHRAQSSSASRDFEAPQQIDQSPPDISNEANSQHIQDQVIQEQEHITITPPVKDIQESIRDHQEDIGKEAPPKVVPEHNEQIPQKMIPDPSESSNDMDNKPDFEMPNHNDDDEKGMPNFERPDINNGDGDNEKQMPSFNPDDGEVDDKMPDIGGDREGGIEDKIPDVGNPDTNDMRDNMPNMDNEDENNPQNSTPDIGNGDENSPQDKMPEIGGDSSEQDKTPEVERKSQEDVGTQAPTPTPAPLPSKSFPKGGFR